MKLNANNTNNKIEKPGIKKKGIQKNNVNFEHNKNKNT